MSDEVNTGDFKDKQFSEKEVASKVIEQYSEKHARVFYKFVMGGGGYDIHYGIFKSATDGVYESSKATNAAIIETMDRTRGLHSGSYVLDLGSGHGGLSHEIASRFGCLVHSFNISAEQNDMNRAEAERLGISSQISISAGDFNDESFPPPELLNKFTHIVSCEVLCHAASKPNLLKALSDMLVPGGILVFTDIMGADGADEKALKYFTDRNATMKMARPSHYLDQLKDAGYVHIGFWDGSYHLEYYFKAMLNVCLEKAEEMVANGVPRSYLDKWIEALSGRCEVESKEHVFAWGIFSARKPGPAF